MSHGSLHDRLVAELVLMGARTSRFAEAIRNEVRDQSDYKDPYYRKEDDSFRRLSIIPDAFVVDASDMRITAYEVEVTSPITAGKLEAYHALFWEIDEYEWLLHLVLVDRVGRHRMVDLLRSSFETQIERTITDVDLARERERLGIRA